MTTCLQYTIYGLVFRQDAGWTSDAVPYAFQHMNESSCVPSPGEMLMLSKWMSVHGTESLQRNSPALPLVWVPDILLKVTSLIVTPVGSVCMCVCVCVCACMCVCACVHMCACVEHSTIKFVITVSCPKHPVLAVFSQTG